MSFVQLLAAVVIGGCISMVCFQAIPTACRYAAIDTVSVPTEPPMSGHPVEGAHP